MSTIKAIYLPENDACTIAQKTAYIDSVTALAMFSPKPAYVPKRAAQGRATFTPGYIAKH